MRHMFDGSTFSDAVRVAQALPRSAGKAELSRVLVAEKLVWDEEERKRLRRENEDGFLLVPEGARVGVHLNRNKPPFFNVKKPRKPGGRSDFEFQTLGHLRALLLSRVEFYVGISGSIATAKLGGSKTPYAGAVGNLTAAEIPDGSFGVVPDTGSAAITYNPMAFPEWRSLFFCINRDVPVTGAAEVVMRDWKLWANGPVVMPDTEIDWYLEQIEVTRDEMGAGGRIASFMRRRVASYAPSFNADPRFATLRPHLIRIAYRHPEVRSAVLPLLG
jgi:hypothetical protein